MTDNFAAVLGGCLRNRLAGLDTVNVYFGSFTAAASPESPGATVSIYPSCVRLTSIQEAVSAPIAVMQYWAR